MANPEDKLWLVEVVRKAEVVVLAKDAREAEKIAVDVYDDGFCDGFCDNIDAFCEKDQLTEKALENARFMRKHGNVVPHDRTDAADASSDTQNPNPHGLTVTRWLKREGGSIVDTAGFRNTADLFEGVK